MEPVFVGLCYNSTHAIDSAEPYGGTGLYHAKLYDTFSSSPVLDPLSRQKFIEFYFWLNNYNPSFGIFVHQERKHNTLCIGSSDTNPDLLHKKGRLFYCSVEGLYKHTIDIAHPATEWLLFNQDLWNPPEV